MTLSREEVAEIAQLARLALGDAELDALAADLTAILDHVAALAAVDTAGVEPMTHAVPAILRPREDVVVAPAAEGGVAFEVPAIIKAPTA